MSQVDFKRSMANFLHFQFFIKFFFLSNSKI